jgi:23S rRNA pseudouridine2605 synthase
MASVRLQKVLAHAGVSSRRAAEELPAAGRVRVDGRVITELGTKVDPREARVEVDGTRVVRQPPVYLILHKPRGVVSTMSDPEGRPTVHDLLGDVSAARVYPVGRLDFNTSGALLVTNDGDFSVALMHPRLAVPKTYVLKVQGMMEDPDVDRWRRGIDLEDGKTLPAKVKLLRHEGDKTWLELTITEGRNQQIRRMGDATGFRVMRLARLSFAGIGTEELAPGKWRYLTAEELSDMKKQFGIPKRIVSPPRPDAAPKRSAVRPAGPSPRGAGSRPAFSRSGSSGGADERSDANPRFGTGPQVRRGPGARDDRAGDRRGFGARSPSHREDAGPPRGRGREDAGPPRGRGREDAGPPRGNAGARGGDSRQGAGAGRGAPPRDTRGRGREDAGPPQGRGREDAGPPRGRGREDAGPPRARSRQDAGPPRGRGREDAGPPRARSREDAGPPRGNAGARGGDNRQGPGARANGRGAAPSRGTRSGGRDEGGPPRGTRSGGQDRAGPPRGRGRR